MHHDHHGSCKVLKRKFGGRFDQRAAGRDDVVNQHRLAAAPSGQIGQFDIDIAIAMADLAQHRVWGANACGDGRYPLLALFVGTDKKGIGRLPRQSSPPAAAPHAAYPSGSCKAPKESNIGADADR